MRLLVLSLLLLAGCEAAAPDQEVTAPHEQSPCASHLFEGSRFTVCPAGKLDIRIVNSDPSGALYGGFASLEAALGDKAGDVAFGINAGMYGEDGKAIGLLIEGGEELHRLNRRGGGGNFGLLPNGVFLVRGNGQAEVVATPKFKPAANIAFATQSGPMLVIDGKLHPAFEPDGESRNIRNGVGIGPDGTPLFAISEDEVSFGKFARLFRDKLKARNALYLDGSVSSLWDPANGRRDARAPLGPMVVAFRRAESAPGRASRATP